MAPAEGDQVNVTEHNAQQTMNIILPALFSSLCITTATCFIPFTSHLTPHSDAQNAASVTRLHLQGDYLDSLGRISLENAGVERTQQKQASSESGGGGQDPYAPGVAEAYGLTDSTGKQCMKKVLQRTCIGNITHPVSTRISSLSSFYVSRGAMMV